MEILNLLDDNIEFTTALKESLEYRGFKYPIEAFNDVDDFKKKLNEDTYAVVVDFFMPKMNGLEITRLIRKVQPECLIILTSINTEKHLPIPPELFTEKYIKFVTKSEDDYIDRVTDYVENHFSLLKSLAELKRIAYS